MRHLRTLRYVDAVARAGSIRKAADDLAITASALNRRIQDFEAEIGMPVFERLARGVRLNAAGELVVRHARAQIADAEGLRSQTAVPSGVRRGRVAIADSQAVAYTVVPDAVGAYVRDLPNVVFEVRVCDHVSAQRALVDFSADLVLVLEPSPQADLHALLVVAQPLHVVMSAHHPLAARETIRLRELAVQPLALLDGSFGGRQILEEALARRSIPLAPMLETNSFELLRAYVRSGRAVTVQFAIGAPERQAAAGIDPGLVSRPLDPRDVAPGRLMLGQLRGRTLPVAAAKFADFVARRLDGGVGLTA